MISGGGSTCFSSLEQAEYALRGALWLARKIDLTEEHIEGLMWALEIITAEKDGRL